MEFEDIREGRVFHNRVYPIFDENGRVVQIACFARDITAEREAGDALAKKNAALEEILSVANEHKKALAHAVVENVDKLIVPLIEDLRPALAARGRETLDLLAERLREIISPFASVLSHQFADLSPTEVRMCDHIRRGKSTDEIANLEHLARATVSKHREHIRRKLGIQGKDINLVQHLNALFSQSGA